MEKLFDASGQARLERAAQTSPMVFVQDGFLDDEDCQEIAVLAAPLLKRATVCGAKAGLHSAGRTGNNCWLKHGASKRIASVVARIAAVLRLPPAHAESLQVIHYGPSQQYRPHYDGWLHDGSEKAQRTLRRGGQRIWTALCYLNTVPRGGSTRFTKLHVDVAAVKGRLLVFSNVVNGTNVRHPLAEHAGMPVLEGEKLAFNLWFRERPAKSAARETVPTLTLPFEMVRLSPAAAASAGRSSAPAGKPAAGATASDGLNAGPDRAAAAAADPATRAAGVATGGEEAAE